MAMANTVRTIVMIPVTILRSDMLDGCIGTRFRSQITRLPIIQNNVYSSYYDKLRDTVKRTRLLGLRKFHAIAERGRCGSGVALADAVPGRVLIGTRSIACTGKD